MKFRPFCLTCMVGLSSVASAETPPLPELWREFPDDTGMVFATEFRLFETAAFLISPAPTERKLAAALALLLGRRGLCGRRQRAQGKGQRQTGAQGVG